MDEQEKDVLFLMVLAASGAVIASGLAAFQQWIIVLPLTVAVFILMILAGLQYKKRYIHLAENLENITMILVLMGIIVSFIYLYRPV
ncbi:MAG: hydrogenase [Methanobacterium sp. ERen5]|nr:MAG: hydrogenase [Methanobacterium sp. ERen5]